jgi:signal transduction histidine kinase
MREHAELLGGTFDIRSAAGLDTSARVAWPLAVARVEG